MVVILNTTINEPSCNSSNNYLEKEQVLSSYRADLVISEKKKLYGIFRCSI